MMVPRHTPLRVLILEDVDNDALLVVRQLEQHGFDVVWTRVETEESFRSALEAEGWDVLIADYNLPTFDAPRAPAVFRASNLEIPFLVVSGTVGAEEAVPTPKLGADDHTVLLPVSLSSCDTVGHSFGPYSREVTDVILRADRGLGELFDVLDEKVGKGRWIAVLTADHGTLPLPEWLREHGIDATRLSMQDLEVSSRKALAPLSEDRDDEIEILKNLPYTGIHRSDEALREAGEDVPALRRRVARALVAGCPWITKAWARDDLEATARRGEAARGDRLLHARSFDEERTPDVVFQLPLRVLLGMAEGTGHGSPYDYDRRIPLIFLGPGFPAGHRPGPAASIDAVPTLLHAAGLEVPEGLDGRVLTE